MFCGTEQRRVDGKGRISFSRNTLKELGDRPIILKRGQHLRLYPGGFRERFRPSRIRQLRVDGSNRILIPRDIIKSLSLLGESVILVGEGDYLAIRPRKKFPYRELTIDLAEKFHRRGISVICDGDRKEVRLVPE